MIDVYQKIAIGIDKISYLVWLGLLISIVLCGYVLFSNQTLIEPDKELLVVVLPMWFLSMIALKGYFINITPRANQDTGFFNRIWISIKRAFSWVIAMIFSVASLAIVYLTFKAITFIL